MFMIVEKVSDLLADLWQTCRSLFSFLFSASRRAKRRRLRKLSKSCLARKMEENFSLDGLKTLCSPGNAFITETQWQQIPRTAGEAAGGCPLGQHLWHNVTRPSATERTPANLLQYVTRVCVAQFIRS